MADFSKSKSEQQSTSVSQSTNASGNASVNAANTFVDPAQAPFLDFLRTMGLDVAGGQLGAGGIGDAAGALGQQLGDAGADLLGSVQGIAAGGGALPGADFLQQRLAEQNPFLNQQIDQLGTDIGRNFQEQILPGLRRDAVAAGGLGGPRDQIGQGIAARGATDAFTRGAGALRFADIGQRQEAAGTLQGGALAQQGIQAQAGLGGLSQLGGLFDLGLGSFGAEFSPLQQLAQILGGPTVLSQQAGASSAFGFGQSSAESQSTGSSSSLGVGVGGTLPFLS